MTQVTTEPKIYKSEVECESDIDGNPTVAIFAIDEALAKRIDKLSAVVRENDAYSIEVFNGAARYYHRDPDDLDGDEDADGLSPEVAEDEAEDGYAENGVNTSSDSLHVSRKEFWFDAVCTRTDDKISTDKMPIADLLAHFGLPASV